MDRDSFLRSAVALEVGLLGLSALLVTVWKIPAETDPLIQNGGLSAGLALVYGVAIGVALFPLFYVCWQTAWRPFRAIREALIETLGPFLLHARHRDVIILALCAGVCEEVLFRGVLEPRLGVVLTNTIFGGLHALTVTYFLVATLLGALFSGMQILTGNLWTPILAHATYDYLAFCWVIFTLRRAAVPPASATPVPPVSESGPNPPPSP